MSPPSVGEIITARIVTVKMDDRLEVIREIYRKVRFHHLFVIENKKLVGVISDRNFLKAISPIGEQCRKLIGIERPSTNLSYKFCRIIQCVGPAPCRQQLKSY